MEQGDQGVGSDSDSTDSSFQRDALPTDHERRACASLGSRALAFPPKRLKQKTAVEEGQATRSDDGGGA